MSLPAWVSDQRPGRRAPAGKPAQGRGLDRQRQAKRQRAIGPDAAVLHDGQPLGHRARRRRGRRRCRPGRPHGRPTGDRGRRRPMASNAGQPPSPGSTMAAQNTAAQALPTSRPTSGKYAARGRSSPARSPQGRASGPVSGTGRRRGRARSRRGRPSEAARQHVVEAGDLPQQGRRRRGPAAAPEGRRCPPPTARRGRGSGAEPAAPQQDLVPALGRAVGEDAVGSRRRPDSSRMATRAAALTMKLSDQDRQARRGGAKDRAGHHGDLQPGRTRQNLERIASEGPPAARSPAPARLRAKPSRHVSDRLPGRCSRRAARAPGGARPGRPRRCSPMPISPTARMSKPSSRGAAGDGGAAGQGGFHFLGRQGRADSGVARALADLGVDQAGWGPGRRRRRRPPPGPRRPRRGQKALALARPASKVATMAVVTAEG